MNLRHTTALVAGLFLFCFQPATAAVGEGVIAASTADAAAAYDSTDGVFLARDAASASINIGRQGTALRYHHAFVIPFQLPDFGTTAAPFDTARLVLTLNNLEGVSGFNVDLYGLPSRTSSAVRPTSASAGNPGDFFMGGLSGSPASDPTPGVVKVQNSLLTAATPTGTVTTSHTGSAQLAAYLNAQYDGGAGVGRWVFLRLSATAVPGGAFRYNVLSANHGTPENRPHIQYNFEPEPDPTVRPMIWVRDTEKPEILDKIASHSWASDMFNALVARHASNLASHQADRDAYIRDLPVDWQLSPARYRTIPQNAESSVRGPTESKFNAALDAAVLHHLTGNPAYAALAADILHNTIRTLLPVAPSTSVGNGGWIFQNDFLKEARVSGTQLPIVYDFLYEHLKANPVYDVQTGGMVDFDHADAQSVFRRFYQLTRDHGQSNNNWSALMSTCMLNNLLALNNEAEREAALQVYLTTGGPRQDSLAKDYQNYNQPGDVWPESLQYANAVANIRATHMVLIERYDPSRNLFNLYPNLPRSLSRVSELVFPNNQLIRFGDGQRSGGNPPYFRMELIYRHALDRGRTDLVNLFGPQINAGVQSGAHNRAALPSYTSLGQHDELLKLLWNAPVVAEPPGAPELPRTDRLPFAGITLQRNPSPTGNPDFGLMGFVGGAAFVHSHASGMSMELYGLGHVLGAKGGRSTYGTPLHNNHYRLFAANNTVVVNGGSRGSGGWQQIAINTVQNVAMEPRASAAPVSPNHSFSTSSFTDDKGTLAQATQQRTLAIVRTSPESGFYVDFFRTRSTVTNRTATTLNGNVTNQYHDYIYRNVGNLNPEVMLDGAPAEFTSQPNRFQNDIGDSYQQPGWRHFTNTVVTAPLNRSIRARFTATVSGLDRCMTMHMPAVAAREVARTESPPIVDAPSPYASRNSPTLVIRQIGDTWDRPFAAVYEPHFGGNGGGVQNVTPLERNGVVVGVRVESTTASGSAVHHIFSNPTDGQTYTDAAAGLSFTGRFGIVADFGGGRVDLYLGQGSALSYRGNSLATLSGNSSQAEARFTPGQEPDVTANAAVNATAAPVQFASWLPTAGNPALNWNIDDHWDSENFPNSTGKIASMALAITGDQTIHLNIPITLGQLAIGDTGGERTMHLRSGRNGSLTFARNGDAPALLTRGEVGTGHVLLDADLDIVLHSDLAVRQAGGTENTTLTIAGDISGAGRAFTKESAGLDLALTADISLSGPIVIDGGTLRLGDGGGTGGFPAISGITINSGVLEVNRGNTFVQSTDLNGHPITGAGGFAQTGGGTTILDTANSYSGPTTIAGGTLRIAASQAISQADLLADATFDMHGHDQTIRTLAGAGFIDNTAPGTTSTLTLEGGTFPGILRNTGADAVLNLVKTGGGTLRLQGRNTLRGSVAIEAGTLAFTETAPLDTAAGILLAGGTTLRPDLVNARIAAPIAITPGSGGVTISAPSVAGAGGTSPVPIHLDGPILGDGDVRLLGIQNTNAYGHVMLNAASSYTGTTLLHTTGGNRNIFVRLGTENALPATTVVTLDGGGGAGGGRFCELDLHGNHQTIAGLTNVAGRDLRSQRVVNKSSSTHAILTIDTTGDFTYGGQLGNGGANLGLAKAGPGTFALTRGGHAYTGATTLAGGTLVLAATNALPAATPVAIGHATLASDAGFANAAGTLAITGEATIDLGLGATLAFAESRTLDWTGGTLTLTGEFVSGSSVRFGGNAAALTPAQLARVSVAGFDRVFLDEDGFLTGGDAIGFDAWIAGTFANGIIPADQRGPYDDFDKDGIPNLLEYALDGLDPTRPNPSPAAVDGTTIQFTKRPATTGLTYRILQSTDLGRSDPWAEVPEGPGYINNESSISYSLPDPSDRRTRFYRLEVQTP